MYYKKMSFFSTTYYAFMEGQLIEIDFQQSTRIEIVPANTEHYRNAKKNAVDLGEEIEKEQFTQALESAMEKLKNIER